MIDMKKLHQGAQAELCDAECQPVATSGDSPEVLRRKKILHWYQYVPLQAPEPTKKGESS